MKRVENWSPKDVSDWLNKEGMPEYTEALQNLDGPALLRLSKVDFQMQSLSLWSSDGGEQLLQRRDALRIANQIEAQKNGHANGHVVGIPNGTSKPQRNGTLEGKGFKGEMIRISMPTMETTRCSFPTEWGKTGIAFSYAIVCFVTTTVVISVVHERVPSKEHTPPLPDKFFDLFDRVEWAFSICEINGMLLVGLWLIQWLLLKHRSIIGRRFFFIVGTLYLYRCITMYITTLPVPGMHFKCSPKLLGNWEAQMRRIMKMIAGGGLSITGSHTMCGDYLYSGHTVMLTLTFLFIKEYSPKRFWWYHWLCWTLSAVGIFCILLAHDHYTVDVVVAYFITTRLFWWYHTMANQQSLKESSQSNPFSRVWWYRLFQFFEENVHGTVPRSYQLPFSWRTLHWNRSVMYSRLDIQ
ncbi:phosphatidylcholine:ceramide cholinephosphotransferase 1 [Austrofundulus limnaeus]|uniref:Phosphatidylcholine:ceramide cholinephosphotransferase 1 n=1 Tax=Austrofundulus limnaeus TaxID=52670 RepID=A0A2I4AQR1_AUSLI|nr:PREDICTED: phosphatidylcholine:ceramide cholinephosphotransferase 1 [Austrofundulus limnaeus]XP_013857818.1 PREDICTED: phosphatidylcholine:ceramide cholinephosphotransferase 1 [Austrofundulus limnaeus]XP_013857825.1 PREDICTED: phosphatidylcholine:ceramide cholinephosphotransferase 1 [Austrofundulus limnaeus]